MTCVKMSVDTPVRYGFEVVIPEDCDNFSIEFVQKQTPNINGGESAIVYTTEQSGDIKSIISCRISDCYGVNKADFGNKIEISEDAKSVLYSVPVNGVPVLGTDYIYMIVVVGYQGEIK